MATAAVVAALDQQAVVDAFMRADAVRPAQAIFFEPKGSIQRSFFRGFTSAGIIKPEGARWYLDVTAYSAATQPAEKDDNNRYCAGRGSGRRGIALTML